MSYPIGNNHRPQVSPQKECSISNFKPDPYIQCHDACDKIPHELMQLICRISCFFAK